MTAGTEEIKSKLIELLSRLFSDKGFETDIIEYIDLIDDAGMDSITFITIIVEIETLFDITVPDDLLLMEKFQTVPQIIEMVKNELSLKEDNNDKA